MHHPLFYKSSQQSWQWASPSSSRRQTLTGEAPTIQLCQMLTKTFFAFFCFPLNTTNTTSSSDWIVILILPWPLLVLHQHWRGCRPPLDHLSTFLSLKHVFYLFVDPTELVPFNQVFTFLGLFHYRFQFSFLWAFVDVFKTRL